MDNTIWTEKYRPKDLEDYNYENQKDIVEIKNWIQDFIDEVPGTPPILLLFGKPGIGKTTLANLIFKKYNIESVEINASEERTKKAMNHILSKITKYKINFDGNKIRMGLLLDEIDGTTTNDKGGLQELIDYIKKYKKVVCSRNNKLNLVRRTVKDNKEEELINNKGNKTIKSKTSKSKTIQEVFKFPIICTCNSIKNKKIASIISNNLFVKLEKPSNTHCLDLINKICDRENILITEEVKNNIIGQSYNDYRQIIFNLHKHYLDGLKSKNSENSKTNKTNKANKGSKTNTDDKEKIMNDIFGGKPILGTEEEIKDDIYDEYSDDYTIKDDIGDNIVSKINYFITQNKNDEIIFKNLQADTIQYYLNIYTNYYVIINKLLDVNHKYEKIKNLDSLKFKYLAIHIDNILNVDKYQNNIFKNQDWELQQYITYIGTYYQIKEYKYLFEKLELKNKEKEFFNKSKTDNYLDLKFHTEYNYMRQEELSVMDTMNDNCNNKSENDIINIYYKLKLEDLNSEIGIGKDAKGKRSNKYYKIRDRIDNF